MKRVLVIAVLIIAGAAFAAETVEELTTVNEYIVKTQNIPALQAFVERNDIEIRPLITYPNPSQEVLDYTRGSYVVSFGTVEQEVADSLVGVLTTLEGMQYVEPNSVIQIEPDTFSSETQPFNMPDSFPWPYTPNDPMYGQQWNIDSMKVNWAWNLTTGNNVKIGIIDFGIDTDHEEFPSINFELSYDFYADNDNIEDTHGHGTRVAGVASAKIDNGLGIAGVAGDCDLCVLKCDKSGGISVSAAVEALYYSADKGISVANMSFASPTQFESLEQAIDYAWEHGVFMCGGAGNDNVSTIYYPAGYEYVMSVGGVTQNMQRWEDSNYGSSVDIYAPVGVPSTKNDGTYYDSRYGTSIASPQIAGLAALLFAENPTWTNQQVWDQIINTADTITIDKGKVLFPNAMKAFDIDSVGVIEHPVTSPLITATQIQQGLINFAYSAPASTPYFLSIYDVTGRGVHSQSGQLAGSGQITCNSMSLSEGVYFWKIATEQGDASGKFVYVR